MERILIIFKTNLDYELISKLQKDNHELVETLNALHEVICITKRNLEIKFLNHKGRTIFNKNNESVIGRKCYELFHNTSSKPATCPLARYIKPGQISKEPTTFFEHGHVIKVTPIFDPEGNCSSLLHQITPNPKAKNENQSMDELRLQTIEQEIYKYDDFKKRLSKKYPQLSAYNLNHSVLIRMNLSTKLTARYFNVNPGSIQRARVRLKKQLYLPEGESLFHFLFHF